jgi:hypothetical protein
MKIKLNGEDVELLIGMDAEFFLKQADGQFIAAARVIPGLKTEPHVLKHGVCHPDGLSLEVGAPPAKDPVGMVKNLYKVLQEVQQLYLTPAGCTLAYTEEVHAQSVVGAQPEDLVFGCGTEFNANNPQFPYRTTTDTNQTQRYSGFHIHLGFTKDQPSNNFTYLDMRRLVLCLDKVFDAAKLQTTERRARQYGGYGAFRVKPYGIEYRMMDCTVITNPDKMKRLLKCLEKLPEIFQIAHKYSASTLQARRLLEIGRSA